MIETFGQRLRRARVEARLSQADLSSIVGIPKPTLSRYENDHVLPAFTTLRRLADGLEVGVATLIDGEPDVGSHLMRTLRDLGVPVTSIADADRIAHDVARSERRRNDRQRGRTRKRK